MAENNLNKPLDSCKGCGVSFTPTRKGNTFCTQRCWRKWKWAAKNKQKTLPGVTCKECDAAFVPAREWQKFCSAACRDKNHAAQGGNSRKTPDETDDDFKERRRGYSRNGLNRWVRKNAEGGLCRACPQKSILDGKACWCERHWMIQAAWRNGLGSGKKSADRVKKMLEDQRYTCPYTGKKLILGVNASIDHKNPRSRFPEQAKDWNNVEWVDLEVNRAKRALTKSEFIALCNQIIDHTSSQHLRTPSP